MTIAVREMLFLETMLYFKTRNKSRIRRVFAACSGGQNMILGLGTDVIEVERIRRTYEQFGDKFVRRVLSSEERQDFQQFSHSRKVEYLAGRFAAKEAVAKATGAGIARIGMPSLSIVKSTTGMTVKWHKDAVVDKTKHESQAETQEESHEVWRAGTWHVSISHTANIAFAVAIWEADKQS
jgi:holo-[acyl-carrier protein] synthase